MLGIDGRTLDEVFWDDADPHRVSDELLQWHFRQSVSANMMGAGEPTFEHDFMGKDIVKVINSEPYGKGWRWSLRGDWGSRMWRLVVNLYDWLNGRGGETVSWKMQVIFTCLARGSALFLYNTGVKLLWRKDSKERTEERRAIYKWREETVGERSECLFIWC